MFPFGVTNAAFLIGAAAAAIPLVIHLIHRRRAPRVHFSTLRFLLVSHQRTARRRRLHNLLILILRMSMMALMAIACAGPFLRSGAFGGPGTGGAVVVVLDNSLSMAAREQATSRYKVAQEAALGILAGLGETDLCTVLFAAGPSPDEPPLLTNNVEELRNTIATSEPRPTTADLPGAIAQAEAQLRDAGFPRRELYVLTDMQRGSWEGAPSAGEPGGAPLPVVVLDCSSTEVRNLAVGEVSVLGRSLVAGAPLTVQATVRNGSPRNEQEVVELFLGQEKRGTRTLALGPHEEKRVQFTVSMEEPGSYWGRLSLPGDGLPDDDVAYFTVSLAGAVPALLVKETTHPIEFLDDTFFLARALNPFAGETVASPTGITPEEVMLQDLSADRLRRYPVTFLVNVGSLDDEQARMLRDYVAVGNSLVIFLGERVRADRYNQLLGDADEGLDRLLPATLADPRGDADGRLRFHRLEEVATDHAIFAPFRGSPAQLLYQVHVYRYFPLTVPAGGGRALAWLVADLGQRQPFVVEGRYGRGHCLMVATGATASWSNLPVTSLFLPLMTSTVHYLVGEARQIAPLRPGVPRSFSAGSAAGSVSVDVTDPRGRTTHLSGGGGGQDLLYRDTHLVGVYRYTLSGPSPETGHFAVNPDARESDLRRIDSEELAGRFPQFALYFPTSLVELETVMARLHQPYQLGAVFFWLLLMVAATEGVLANRISARLVSENEEGRR